MDNSMLKAQLQAAGEEAIKVLLSLMQNKDLDPALRLAAAQELLRALREQ